jgi:hypothetical protein
MQTEQIVKELLSSQPVRTLQRSATHAGRSLNRAGRTLNRQLRRHPQLSSLAALLGSQLATLMLVRRRVAVPRPTFASRAAAIGAVAGGALAIGAMSIGALAIARVAIRSMRIKHLQVDALEVRQTFGTQLVSEQSPPGTPA